jgi:hypothetical protein
MIYFNFSLSKDSDNIFHNLPYQINITWSFNLKLIKFQHFSECFTQKIKSVISEIFFKIIGVRIIEKIIITVNICQFS